MKRRRPVINDENTLLVITSFPDNTRGTRDARPVALHSKRILTQLSKHQNILVIAERTGRKITHVENRKLMVQRIWKRRKPLSLLSIIPTLIKYNRIQKILIHFDFDVFGGLKPLFFFPIILLLFKAMRKQIYFEFHQISFEIQSLKRHNDIDNTWIKRFLNLFLFVFYRWIGLLSDKVLVFEEDLKERLSRHMPVEKIITLPVGVTPMKTVSQVRSKKKLGFSRNDFVVLVFGFFDWYKGTDWIAKTFGQSRQKNIRLLLVGGKHPAFRKNKNYQSYYRQVQKIAHESSRIKTVGFVPAHEIPLYFSAADIITLPHREFLSTSMTFSYALGFQKPVILSNKLLDYMKSPDLLYSREQAGIEINDLFFSLNKADFELLLKKIKQDKTLYKKLVTFSHVLAKKRRADRLIRDYKTIVSRSYILSPRFAFK